jgi:hypothetical protein
MASPKDLRLALEIVTEGPAGEDVIMPEGLRLEAESAHAAATPWVTEEGVVGYGIGKKITGGQVTNDLALKIYVKEKKPLAELAAPAPKSLELPGIAGSVPTDVEAIGELQLELLIDRLRPTVPGFGVGHPDVTVGTFGCLVQKQNDGDGLYILSNSHVLANSGLGTAGDPIVQPGKRDGGMAPADILAELAEWSPFQFTSGTFPNRVDAAIAKVLAPDQVKSAIRRIGVPKGVSRYVRRGMHVQKTGRTTDYTTGVIKDVNFRAALTYEKPDGSLGRVGFRDQVLCTRYTAGGDSGSAVLNMQGKIVGLHFAGSEMTSVFNRITYVLDALQIQIVTQDI